MSQQRELTNLDVLRMRDSLRVFHDELGALIGSNLWPTPPGSQAAAELASSPDCQEDLHTAFSQGAFLVESAADHLMLSAKALDEPVQTLAHLTCARGVLEACAVAVWLLDPGISGEERVSRSMGRRIQSLRELRKFCKASGSEEMIDHARARLDHATLKPTAIGIAAASMPGSTEIIKQMLDDEIEYRLLSAVAHGHNWALVKAGYGVAVQVSSAEGLSKISKEICPIFTCFAGLRALLAIKRAAWCLVTLFGLDRKRFAEIVDGYYDRIGACPKGDLYWRVL